MLVKEFSLRKVQSVEQIEEELDILGVNLNQDSMREADLPPKLKSFFILRLLEEPSFDETANMGGTSTLKFACDSDKERT